MQQQTELDGVLPRLKSVPPRFLSAPGHQEEHFAFSLLELLVTMAVLSLFVLLLSTITDNSFKLWRSTQSSITMFESARTAYDTLTRRLSQATLNTYLDYYDKDWIRRDPLSSSAFVPTRYGRASDLHFLSGDAAAAMGGNQTGHGVFFFAPLGFTDNNATYADLPNLLNACGYYVEWGDDSAYRPAFLSSLDKKSRFRLIENILPSQSFDTSAGGYPSLTDIDLTNDDKWISAGLAGTGSMRNVLAENIIALVIRPEVAEQDSSLLGLTKPYDLTADYTYDSRAGRTLAPLQFAQLPPMLRVVMVAVDEKSAARLTTGTAKPAALTLKSTWFTNPAKLDDDLKELSKQLVDANVQFRIFNQVIALRGAKFSAQKEN